MVSSIKDRITSFIKSDDKKIKIITIIGALGIALILLSGFTGGNKSNTNTAEKEQLSYEAYTQELENKLSNIISSISGVGECEVMITLENSYESVYATNSEFKNNDDSVNQKDEYVIYDADSGETPVLIKEYMPKVMGVSIVCSGGENIEVKEKVIESVTALFNIPTNRVSVSKIKS
ncbi:MAG: hypothetical protein J1E81_06460 [Eubacterium sp.]|nr:hypothetical protein [Eubacterium sp.]